jgi:hypothetical protein
MQQTPCSPRRLVHDLLHNAAVAKNMPSSGVAEPNQKMNGEREVAYFSMKSLLGAT